MRLKSAARSLTVRNAARLIAEHRNSVTFLSPVLRPRELKMATALRRLGWKVVIVYTQTTPFNPEGYVDVAIRVADHKEMHKVAKALQPRVCHAFLGAVDESLVRFFRDKPGPIVIDFQDIFCPSLLNYCHERFEPTREVLSLADGICSRDLQPVYAKRIDGYRLPRHSILFPEYSWDNGPADPRAKKKRPADEVHVVLVGSFFLESKGMYDSCYLQIARMLTERRIHFHIYPHWFYRKAPGSSFNFDLKADFCDFFELQERTSYMHIYESLPLDELARELPQYDFGIVSGGSAAFGHKMNSLTNNYMRSCFSGRITDYLDARMPVLINPEVAFNFAVAHRHGFGIDLNGLLQPDFREQLLEMKHDSTRRNMVENAAQALALDRHAPRLVKFYNAIIAEGERQTVRRSLTMRSSSRLPKVRARLWRLAHELNSAIGLKARELRAERDALQERCTWLQNQNEQYEAQVNAERANSAAQLAELSKEIKIESTSVNDIADLLNWPEITRKIDRSNGFTELLRLMHLSAPAGPKKQTAKGRQGCDQVSSAWHILNRKNLDQLLIDGYRNFKRTVAFNYFTFPVVEPNDPQIRALQALLSPEEIQRCWMAAQELPDDPTLTLKNQTYYRYLVLMLWTYVSNLDKLQCLNRLEEPAEGNPVLLPVSGRSASQDLANSVLEYYAMREAVDFERCKRVLEIGGGYGRNAYVVMTLHPDTQYTMVDIPPALYIAQRYLSTVFPSRKIFRARNFKNYDEVQAEIEEASLVFLLPHQIAMLPEHRFDLVINVSSFGEMRLDQIKTYFAEIARLTRGHFYTKQWKGSKNPFDGMVLTEADYPVRPNWTKVYSRSCPVQNQFFEALYGISGDRS